MALTDSQRKRIELKEKEIKNAENRVNEIKTAIKILSLANKYFDDKYSEYFEGSKEVLELWLLDWEWFIKDARLKIQAILEERLSSRWQI